VFSDLKTPITNNGQTVTGYEVAIIQNSDYSPFGAELDGRTTSGTYRYLFQAQEMDDEIKGDGNSVNYKYRMHDPRLGRFFSVDPLAAKYPHNSLYAFSENDVIAHVELEGLEKAELPFKGGKPNPKAGKADFSAHEEKTPMLQGGPGLKETPNAMLMPTKKKESISNLQS
jgi:RHS repeat-associated protein